MAGIFPDSGVAPANTANAVDGDVEANCAELFYSVTLCQPRFNPAAMNAIISELINIVNAGGSAYDCSRLDNVARAIGAVPPPTAQAGDVIPNGAFYLSSTGELLYNGTGAAITVVDPSTAGLTAQGMREVPGNPIATPVATGDVVQPGEFVCSDDGGLFVNKTGAAVTATGTTGNAIAGDGLTEIPGVPTAQLPNTGQVIPDGGIVCSSDGTVMINKTGGDVVTPIDRTEAGMTTAGLTPFQTGSPRLSEAQAGTTIRDCEIFKSTDGEVFVNLTGADYLPGPTTSAGLAAAGMTPLQGEFEMELRSDLVTRPDFPASGFVGDFANRPESYIDDSVCPAIPMFFDPCGPGGAGPGAYVPGNGYTDTQLAALDGVAAGGTYPADGFPNTYVDTSGTEPQLFYWNDANGAYEAVGGATAPVTPPAVYPNSQSFNFTGGDQSFTIPAATTFIRVTMWGAGGGGATTSHGGSGGFVQAEFPIDGTTFNNGDTFAVMVGEGGGRNVSTSPVGPIVSGPDPYGFGGAGSSTTGSTGFDGGGLSGIFTGTGAIDLAAVAGARALMIAGGGGGASTPGNNPGGGAGSPTSGTMPTAQGYSNNGAGFTGRRGGGGGGRNGGDVVTNQASNGDTNALGGSSFVTGAAFSSSVDFTADGDRTAPQNTAAQYTAPAGAGSNVAAGTNDGLVVIEFD